MKTHSALIFAAALIAFGCTYVSPPIAAGKKEELRKILHPKFVSASIPKEKEEEFYGVLEGFTDRRRPDELVRSVKFRSPTATNSAIPSRIAATEYLSSVLSCE
jgi:hypothetical protein